MTKKSEPAATTTTAEPEFQPRPDTHEANNILAEADMNKKPDETDVLTLLRVSQDFAAKAGSKKVITTVPIRNPKRGEFLRVHPTMEPMLVYTLVDEQETFVATASIAINFPGDMIPKLLAPTISRQGTLFLWALRIPGEDGRINNWHASAKEVYEAVGAIPDPEWPSLSMDEIVRIAVKGRVIDSLDHPVLQKLRGEV